MLWWKLLALVDVALNLGFWLAVFRGRTKLDRFDLITIPVGLAGTLGLLCYAFSMSTLPQVFWRLILPIFILVSGWEIAKKVTEPNADRDTYVATIPVLFLIGFMAVALYRLGGERWVGVLGA